MPVPNGVVLLRNLSLIEMRLAVPLSGEVILVFAPGDAGIVHRYKSNNRSQNISQYIDMEQSADGEKNLYLR